MLNELIALTQEYVCENPVKKMWERWVLLTNISQSRFFTTFYMHISHACKKLYREAVS